MIFKLIKKIFKKDNSKHLIQSISLSGKECLLMNQKKYDEYKDINQAEFKIFSQNGEDGIIDYLLYKLKIQDPIYVELGVENYDEANTRFLYETTNSRGLIIDGTFDVNELKQKFESWKGRLNIVNKFVTPDNICTILESHNFNKDLDIFSIDIDGIDYWVIKNMPNEISKIFIAEYNPLFGPNLEVTVPNIKNFNRTKYHYSNLCWGMSLKSLVNLMSKKGYTLLGTNTLKNNAFFVLEVHKSNFEEIFKNVNLKDFKNFTNHKFLESRDQKGKLTYLNADQQIELIQECEVMDLASGKERLVKIRELI